MPFVGQGPDRESLGSITESDATGVDRVGGDEWALGRRAPAWRSAPEMTALELVTLLFQAVTVLLFVLVSVPALRAPTRVGVDTALFFAAFAAVIAAGRVTQLLGV